MEKTFNIFFEYLIILKRVEMKGKMSQENKGGFKNDTEQQKAFKDVDNIQS